MTGENRPSNPSMYDRSTIGSSKELDEYGVWVKSEPQDLSSAGNSEGNLDIPLSPDLSEEISRDEPLEPSPEPSVSSIEESSDSDMDELLDLDELSEDAELDDTFSFSDDDLIEDDSMDNILIEDSELSDDDFEPPQGTSEDSGSIDLSKDSPEKAMTALETDDDQEGFTEITMEDFLTFELNNDEQADPFATEPGSNEEADNFPPSSQAPELSAQLLMKIVEELASIKSELVGLKKELASYHRNAPVEEHTEPSGGGGFFEEDNDEKIALTGDELDNILQNADFTEETGADVGLSEDNIIDFSPDSFSKEDNSGDLPEFEITIDDTPMDSPIEEDTDLELDSSPELQLLVEEGAQPMSDVPEDTSYIDEDPLGGDTAYELDLDESSLDFSNAVIDEPDLSRDLKENPINEPVIDDLSLDLEFKDPELTFDDTDTADGIDEEPAFEEINLLDETQEKTDDNEDIDYNKTDGSPEPEASESAASGLSAIPPNIRRELCTVLSYMDQLLESLPEDKIEEFAKSEYFDTYKKLFEELGLV